jgi:hypothetical protein
LIGLYVDGPRSAVALVDDIDVGAAFLGAAIHTDSFSEIRSERNHAMLPYFRPGVIADAGYRNAWPMEWPRLVYQTFEADDPELYVSTTRRFLAALSWSELFVIARIDFAYVVSWLMRDRYAKTLMLLLKVTRAILVVALPGALNIDAFELPPAAVGLMLTMIEIVEAQGIPVLGTWLFTVVGLFGRSVVLSALPVQLIVNAILGIGDRPLFTGAVYTFIALRVARRNGLWMPAYVAMQIFNLAIVAFAIAVDTKVVFDFASLASVVLSLIVCLAQLDRSWRFGTYLTLLVTSSKTPTPLLVMNPAHWMVANAPAFCAQRHAAFRIGLPAMFGPRWPRVLVGKALRVLGVTRSTDSEIVLDSGTRVPVRPTAAEDGRCARCLDDFAEGDMVIDLPCGHLFHVDCGSDLRTGRVKCAHCGAWL